MRANPAVLLACAVPAAASIASAEVDGSDDWQAEGVEEDDLLNIREQADPPRATGVLRAFCLATGEREGGT